MDSSIFDAESAKTLNLIMSFVESKDSDENWDIEFNGDIIEIITENGIFIINKHSSAKEIWLASPISGPHHFRLIEGKWLNRNMNDIFDILDKELS